MSAISTARPSSPGRALLRSAQAAPYRAVAAVALAVGIDQAFDPTHTHIPTCPLHSLTGIWCPFCGGLRSAYELTRLHFSAAWHYNVMFIIALPFLGAIWIDWALRARHGQRRRAIPRKAVLVVVVVLLLFAVVRNLPFAATLRGA